MPADYFDTSGVTHGPVLKLEQRDVKVENVVSMVKQSTLVSPAVQARQDLPVLYNDPGLPQLACHRAQRTGGGTRGQVDKGSGMCYVNHCSNVAWRHRVKGFDCWHGRHQEDSPRCDALPSPHHSSPLLVRGVAHNQQGLRIRPRFTETASFANAAG